QRRAVAIVCLVALAPVATALPACLRCTTILTDPRTAAMIDAIATAEEPALRVPHIMATPDREPDASNAPAIAPPTIAPPAIPRAPLGWARVYCVAMRK